MEQNIFQVINESHLDEILSQHVRDMVVIMLSSKDCAPCRVIKPKFVALSKEHSDVFFVYIDKSNYAVTQNKYFTEFEYTPTFVFYFGGNKIAFVEGGHEPSLVRAIMVLKQKIDEKRHEFQQQEKLLEEQKTKELEAVNLLKKMQTPSQQSTQNNLQQTKQVQQQAPQQVQQQTPQQVQQQTPQQVHQQAPPQITEELILLNKKMELLKNLRELNNMGVQLTKNYNLDSSIEEMMFEFQFQTNPQFKQQILKQQLLMHQEVVDNQPEPKQEPVPVPVNNQTKEKLAKKQEQVRQIQELDMLNKKMQQQSFQKLQQLRRIQQMKEQQEKNNEKE
jgi:thiol-disulfide isomerase/thioredoxin